MPSQPHKEKCRFGEAERHFNGLKELQMDNTTKPAGNASLSLPSASNLAKELGAKKRGNGWLAPCPAHADRTPSLSIKGTNTRLLLHCFAGCEYAAIVEALEDLGYLDKRARTTGQAPTCKEHDEAEARRKQQQKAQTLWHTAGEIKPGDPAYRYLTETRRLRLSHIPTELRIAPSLEYWTTDGDKPRLVARTPAMLAAVRSLSGELLGVHRTYLSPDGQKFNPEAYNLPRHAPIKKVMGSIANGAIHLYEPGETLLIAEGIETALAAHVLSGLPAWAAISSSNMGRLEVPGGVKTVIICVDNDEAGRRAAAALTERLQSEGKQVEWSEPGLVMGAAKCDWADYLINEGVA